MKLRRESLVVLRVFSLEEHFSGTLDIEQQHTHEYQGGPHLTNVDKNLETI